MRLLSHYDFGLWQKVWCNRYKSSCSHPVPSENSVCDYLANKMEQKNEKKEDDEKMHYLRREFSYTKYEQALILPDDVDKEKIAARVNDGILTVDLPKIEETKVKVARAIEIG